MPDPGLAPPTPHPWAPPLFPGAPGRGLLSTQPFFPGPLLPSVSVALRPAGRQQPSGPQGAAARPFPSGPPRPQPTETAGGGSAESGTGWVGAGQIQSSAAPGADACAGNSRPEAQEGAAAQGAGRGAGGRQDPQSRRWTGQGWGSRSGRAWPVAA